MTEDELRAKHPTFPIRKAAETIGCDFLSLLHVIEVGDLLPAGMPSDIEPGRKFWSTHLDDIGFSADDIEKFRVEIHERRAFKDFRTEYSDVFQTDTGPGARGLEFGPGWGDILCTFADGLRAIQARGHRAQLRWGKEKFGALRLFTDTDEDAWVEVGFLKGIAYRASLRSCQECGQPGRLRMGHGVCLTLCDRHKHIVGDIDPERDGIILDVDAWSLEQGRLAE